MSISALNNRLNRQRNKVIIMSLVRMYPGIPRADIARTIGLSPTAITDLVNDLLKENLVVEGGASTSKHGRKPVRLEIATKQHFFLTIHLGGEYIRLAVMDLNANILSLKIVETQKHDTLDSKLELLHGAIDETMRESETTWEQIEAIGCGVSAHVDPLKGIIQYSENISGMHNIPIKEILENYYGKPCYVEGNPHLLTLAERYYGEGRGIQNFVYLNVGIGISLGIFANGALYSGFNSSSGEVGHIPVPGNGVQCNCGRYGCLESVASSKQIRKSVLRSLENGVRSSLHDKFQENRANITAETIAEAAEQGDLMAATAIRRAGDHISQILLGVIHTLNPEVVIMGGPIFAKYKYLLNYIRTALKQNLLPYVADGLKIETSELDYDQSFLVGALILISERHWAPGSAAFKEDTSADNLETNNTRFRSGSVEGNSVE